TVNASNRQSPLFYSPLPRSHPPIAVCADARWARRQVHGREKTTAEDAIGEPDRFLDIVSHNERRYRPAKNEFAELAAQSIGQCRVKRDEWFVQNQKIGFDCEGAG